MDIWTMDIRTIAIAITLVVGGVLVIISIWVMGWSKKPQKKEPEMMGCWAYDESATKNLVSGHDHSPGKQSASFPFGTTVLWKKNELRVYFMDDVPLSHKWKIDGDPINRDLILNLANVWRDETRCGSVPKFVRANSIEQSDIRVKFECKGGSHSYIGTLAEKYPDKETMVLNLGVGEDYYKKHLVRHEFGHVLGLGHEQQSKNAPKGLIIKQKVIDWLMEQGVTEEQAKGKYDTDYKKPPPTQYSDEVATKLDPISIMQYWIDKDWIDPNHAYARKHPSILTHGINIPPRDTPSQLDLEEIKKRYTELYQQPDLDLPVPGGDGRGGDGGNGGVTTRGAEHPKRRVAQDTSDPAVSPPVEHPTRATPELPIFGDRPNLQMIQLINWNDGGQERQFRLLPRISHRWNALGGTFGIEQGILDGFQIQNMLNQENCCRAVIQRWLENGSNMYPVTWEGLFNALRADGTLGTIADDLRKALSNTTSPAASSTATRVVPGGPPPPQQTSGNREYDRLLEYSDTLITQLAAALCSGTLAQKLRAKKLITSDLYDSATNAGQGITEKTRIRPIIQYVMTQTKENREIFHKFLTVLRDIEGLGDLVKCLEV